MMRRFAPYCIFVVMSILCLPQTGWPAEGRHPISGPIVITQPGAYLLTQNINTTTNPIIDIRVKDVTIDFGGFSITSSDTANAVVTTSVSGANITIKNGSIISSASGISFNSPKGTLNLLNFKITIQSGNGDAVFVLGDSIDNATLFGENIQLTGPGGTANAWGFNLRYVEGSILKAKASLFNYGLYGSSLTQFKIKESNFSRNQTYGIYLYIGTALFLEGNNASNNGDSGIILFSVSYSTIQNNTASNNPFNGLNADNQSDYNTFDGNVAGCTGSDNGIVISGCGNIYSNNKTPGVCSIVVSSPQGCIYPNTDGGGNVS